MTTRGTTQGSKSLFEAYLLGLAMASKWALDLAIPAIVTAYVWTSILKSKQAVETTTDQR